MTNGEVADLMYKVFIMALQLGGPVLVVSMQWVSLYPSFRPPPRYTSRR